MVVPASPRQEDGRAGRAEEEEGENAGMARERICGH